MHGYALHALRMNSKPLESYLVKNFTRLSFYFILQQQLLSLIYVCLTLRRADVSTGYTLLSRSNVTVLIADIRALWRSALSARLSECQQLKCTLDLDGVVHY